MWVLLLSGRALQSGCESALWRCGLSGLLQLNPLSQRLLKRKRRARLTGTLPALPKCLSRFNFHNWARAGVTR